MSRYSMFAAAITVAFLVAPLGKPLAAQTSVQEQNAAVVVTVPVVADAPVSVATDAARGPLMKDAAVGVRLSAGQAPLATPPKFQATGRNPAMMIVGGAALIVGAVVGGQAGTIVMIAGGIIGLVGLWNYLQ
jgi:hypothetical protein